MEIFTKEPLYIDDIVVYLKNARTGSSSVRKCKFIGQVIGFTKTKVKIGRMSQPDTFVTPEECKDLGVDTVYPEDIVHIIISKKRNNRTMFFPQIIGDINYENKEELIEWVEAQQNRLKQIDLFSSMSQTDNVVGDTILNVINKMEV